MNRPSLLIWLVLLLAIAALRLLVFTERSPAGQTLADSFAQHIARLAHDKDTALPVFTYRVRNSYPHDPQAFTQGLLHHGGSLYESTGGWGNSTLRQVELETGRVLRSRTLSSDFFAEGLSLWGDRLIQLTWREGKGFLCARDDLAPLATFSYRGEGWGLTHDHRRLIMSDGTSFLRFFDPESLRETGQMQVRAGKVPVSRLNELEFVDGQIFANIWETDFIARIDPATGQVVGWIDLRGLLPAKDRPPGTDVLNGIAYDPIQDRLFVTGKNWPKVFEIELVEKKR